MYVSVIWYLLFCPMSIKERKERNLKEKPSFEENIIKYQATWFRIALGIVKRSADAEEIVCESILKAYEKRETLRKVSSFKSWMTSIVLHTAYDYVRKNHDAGYMVDEMWEGVFPSAEQEVMERESRNYIYNQVQKLEEPFRIVIILYYYEEFSTKEISEMLGISRGTVKSRLARGRGKLSDYLGKELT